MSKVNRITLSEFIGCAPATIDKAVKDGAPFLERPDKTLGTREWLFDSADFVAWLVDNGGGGSTKDEVGKQNLRLKTAEAGLKELDLGERQKVLVHVDDVAAVVEEQYGIVKSRMKAIPGRLAQLISVESDPEKCRVMLQNEVDGALEAISSAEISEKAVQNAE